MGKEDYFGIVQHSRLLIKTISPKISILCLLTAAKFYPLIFLKMIKDRFSRKTNPS